MCSMCIGGLGPCVACVLVVFMCAPMHGLPKWMWKGGLKMHGWSEMAMCKPCVLTGVFAIFGFLALSIILGPFVSCVHCCPYVWPCACICLVMYRCTGGPNGPCVACV